MYLSVKEFLKSVDIWWRYKQKFGGMFFFTHGVINAALDEKVLPNLHIQGHYYIVLHRESKKTCHQTFVYIFTKYWPILKILSLTYSVVNL